MNYENSLALENFKLPTYKELEWEVSMPEHIDSYYHTWGHKPFTYDYEEYFGEPHGEFFLFNDWNTNMIVRKIEHPIEKFSEMLTCSECGRTAAQLLSDMKLAPFFYFEAYYKDPETTRIYYSLRSVEDAKARMAKVESGVQVESKFPPYFMCGNCLSKKYTDFAVTIHKHNYKWKESLIMDRALKGVKDSIEKGKSSNNNVVDAEIKNGKIVLKKTSDFYQLFYSGNRDEDGELIPLALTDGNFGKEMKFIKDMGFKTGFDEELGSYYFIS